MSTRPSTAVGQHADSLRRDGGRGRAEPGGGGPGPCRPRQRRPVRHWRRHQQVVRPRHPGDGQGLQRGWRGRPTGRPRLGTNADLFEEADSTGNATPSTTNVTTAATANAPTEPWSLLCPCCPDETGPGCREVNTNPRPGYGPIHQRHLRRLRSQHRPGSHRCSRSAVTPTCETVATSYGRRQSVTLQLWVTVMLWTRQLSSSTHVCTAEYMAVRHC